MELFIGRLHPLMVHFPIALLVVAQFMELFTIGGRRPGLRQGINWMVTLGAMLAVFAAILGWFLRNFDDYGGDLVQLHQNWGIITACFATATAAVLQATLKGHLSNLLAYRATLLLTVIFVAVTSHLGASLTHGDDYLSSAWADNTEVFDDGRATRLLADLKLRDSLSEDHLDQLNLEVRAIFARHCYQCHSEHKNKGDLVLEHKRGVYQGGESGSVITAGVSAKSELFRRISLPSHSDEVMPKKGKTLKDHQIALIKLWIDSGAHWADRALEVFPEAPLALIQTSPPLNTGQSHPIDRYIDEYFNENSKSWPQVVDDRTFIRRAYMDILGLLPDPEAVFSFINDSDLNKRDKLIDQLLADDHNYTQNWLSFWNDLLRNDYSGTGYITGGRKEITEWLYQFLLYNKPYHQMVRELVNPTEDSEGFIKGIKWRGVVNASQSTEMQAAQNISQSLMGMNLKCASCHNSFVSNLTLDQAYGFASIFADSALELNRCDQPLGRTAKAEFLYTELGSVEAETIKERLLKLSEIITKPENGRLYRTVTNRYWKKLLGRGLVEPVDDMDQESWHGDLLDWLASEFISSGYDIKRLIALIMKSKTYQLPAVNYARPVDLSTENYVFTGPVIRRLTAEQFSDAVSQIVTPMYHATAYDPAAASFAMNRIWHREIKFDRDVLPEPGDRYFRHKFDLGDQPIRSAKLLVSVDDSYTLYLNESVISQGKDWRKTHKIEVSNWLKPGANLFAIKATNTGNLANPAGILLVMKIIHENGDSLLVRSGTDWVSTDDQPTNDWISIDYSDENWINVRDYGSKHWDQLVDMSFEHRDNRFARASLVRQHPFMKALGRPSRENVATTRDDQATLLQALELTNGVYFNHAIMDGANHWLNDNQQNGEQIAITLYQKAYSRTPNSGELKVLTKQLGEVPTQEKLQDVMWAILLSPEFQFIY